MNNPTNLNTSLDLTSPRMFEAASQSLLHTKTDSPWSSEILENKLIVRHANRRLRLVTLLERCYSLVPDVTMGIDDALFAGRVDEETVTTLYALLTEFLTEEECGERLLLYLPFELIPGTTCGNFGDRLETARDLFVATYLEKWNCALKRQNIRADFVDGNIPDYEIRTEPLQFVVKAAHLAPILIRKGLVTHAEIEQIVQKSDCHTLRRSLTEALFAERKPEQERIRSESPARLFGWLVATFRNAQDDMDRAEKRIKTQEGKPEARIAWETEKEMGRISQAYSRLVADMINAGRLAVTDLSQFLVQAENRTVTALAIAAAYQLLESEADIDKALARKTHLILKPALEKCWREGEVREELYGLWLRLVVLNVLQESEIQAYGITTVKFDNPSSDVLAPYIGISDAITMDEELSTFLLPVIIASGSRIKGYGTEQSDIDFAVFVRPGIRFEDRIRIESLLSEVLEPFGITGRTFQFWLENDGDLLKIRDFGTNDRYLGTSVLTHPLFACPWLGDRRSIERLYKRLLTPYLTLKEVVAFGERTRRIWLEDLESSALLYRLMHKGYYRCNPIRRSPLVSEGVADSDSAFWDSGYRRIATLIFLKKVFLPHIRSE